MLDVSSTHQPQYLRFNYFRRRCEIRLTAAKYVNSTICNEPKNIRKLIETLERRTLLIYETNQFFNERLRQSRSLSQYNPRAGQQKKN